MKNLILILGLISLIGCTTPVKRSNPTYLAGEPVGIPAERMVEDLSRTLYLSKMEKAEVMEVGGNMRMREFPRQTDTWIKVYPYTKPLVFAQTQDRISEQAFKERWPKDKEFSAFAAEFAAAKEKLINKGQCFRIEINTSNPSALELQYWYGAVRQGETKVDLAFSEGFGFSETSNHVYVNQVGAVAYANSYVTTKYFYYADACTNKPINLLKEFDLSVEPRYERGLIPAELKWLETTKI